MPKELLSFALIGAAAFIVDSLVLYAGLLAGGGFYVSRVASWTVAATFTWYLNRRLTFRDAAAAPPIRQWLRFLSANAVGGAVNYGAYAAAIGYSPLAREWPVLAVGAGSVAGLFLNFGLSRQFVFQRK